jgi:arsenite methyltransferase
MTASARDLMFQDEVRSGVATAYRAIDAGGGRAVAERLYRRVDLAAVPDEAVSWALGVGDPVRHARLSPGEVVLDVGCGGGIDTLLAARRVGTTGRVTGLDLLPEMCARTRAAAEAARVSAWCDVLPGAMEAIPLPDASVDVVISNGVLNLSPRKSRALAEIARVLRSGGRLCVADLVVDEDLPPDALAIDAAWAGCIAGAVSRRVLRGKLERAGFEDVELDEPVALGVEDLARYPLLTPEVIDLLRETLPPARQEHVATAMIITAVRSAAAPTSRRRAAPTTTRTRRLDEIPEAEGPRRDRPEPQAGRGHRAEGHGRRTRVRHPVAHPCPRARRRRRRRGWRPAATGRP